MNNIFLDILNILLNKYFNILRCKASCRSDADGTNVTVILNVHNHAGNANKAKPLKKKKKKLKKSRQEQHASNQNVYNESAANDSDPNLIIPD